MTGCRSRTCAINRAGGMRVSEPCSCDPALVATLRERGAIIARLRRKARAHERLARLRKSPALRQWWDWDRATYHEGAADALEKMADRIERGDV